MPLSTTQLDALAVMKKATNILVLPSAPLDGDSIGSALALYLAFKKLGKKATVVATETIPASYNFLPEISAVTKEFNFVRDLVVTIDCRSEPMPNVRQEIQGNKINIIITPQKGAVSKEQVSFSQGQIPYDCVVTVDAADVSQLGKIYDDFTELFNLAPMINIDHHTSNNGFGKINLVDIMASSTTTLVLPLIEELGAGLMDADIATLLLAGLITDTGSFQNPNTTPDSFEHAAKLIGYGARQQEIIRHIYKTKRLSTLRLWGRTLTKLQYDEQTRIVWSVLTAKDFAEIGSSTDETEGVIDELMSNAPGAEIIMLIKEKSPTEVSGSIRTITSTIDASKLAAMFGGGGHAQAAGFKMQGKNIVEAEQAVVSAIKDFQSKRLNLIPPTPTMPSTTHFAPQNALPSESAKQTTQTAERFVLPSESAKQISPATTPPSPITPTPSEPTQPVQRPYSWPTTQTAPQFAPSSESAKQTFTTPTPAKPEFPTPPNL